MESGGEIHIHPKYLFGLPECSDSIRHLSNDQDTWYVRQLEIYSFVCLFSLPMTVQYRFRIIKCLSGSKFWKMD